MNDNMLYREEIEWSNTWISKVKQNCRRCLLIGDSTTRELRSKLESMAGDMMAVDLFAASYAITDEWFWKSFNSFLQITGYTYDLIILHYGFHHGWRRQCCNDKEEWKQFFECYEHLIIEMKKICENVIVMTGADISPDGRIEPERIEIYKKEVIARNEIAKVVAKNNTVNVFDLYNLMKTEGTEYSYKDWIHFEKRANYFIAYKILKYIVDEYEDFADVAKVINTVKLEEWSSI